MPTVRRTLPLAASLALAPAALAGVNATAIPLAGLRIQHNLNQSASSAPDTVGAAYIYNTTIDGTAHGSGGVLGLLFPSATPIAQILEQLTGAPVDLSGSVYNATGALPASSAPTTLAGSTVVSGITVTYSFTLTTSINASGVASFSITGVVLNPSFLVGALVFDSGAATIARVCPGDTNGDNAINFADLNQVLSEFGLVGLPGDFAGDVNADGAVSFADLNIVLSQFGTGC